MRRAAQRHHAGRGRSHKSAMGAKRLPAPEADPGIVSDRIPEMGNTAVIKPPLVLATVKAFREVVDLTKSMGSN